MMQSPAISLQEYQRLGSTAGTAIPVHMEIAGDLFETGAAPLLLPLVLKQPMELWMVDGKLTGNARQPGSPWTKGPETRINIPWVKGEISPQAGPLLKASLVVQFLPSTAP